jgi:ketosteroid isomerase-like protein
MKTRPPFRAKITLHLCLVVLAMAIAALASPEFRQASSGSEQEKRVREFVEAFNTRKIDVMLELAAENIQWMHIDGAKVSIEVEGKTALRGSMERYFSSCSSCRSSLEWVQIAGSRVTAMERASWDSRTGPKSQRSLSVYEFRGDKILHVHYFPAEPVTQPPQVK